MFQNSIRNLSRLFATAAMFAAQNGHYEIAELLLDQELQITRIDDNF